MLRTHGKKKENSQPHGTTSSGTKIANPAELRVRKELAELQLPTQIRLKCESPDSVMRLRTQIQPNEGYWAGGSFTFKITIPYGYPHDPPKVRCEQKIYHPNINTEGAVCLNILRDDWKPILSIYAVLIGLLHLFLEPEVFEPLNQDAANLLATNPAMFTGLVRDSMRGWSDGVNYDCVYDTGDSF